MDWGDDEPHEPGDGGTGSGGGNEGTDPDDVNGTNEPEPELYELAFARQFGDGKPANWHSGGQS